MGFFGTETGRKERTGWFRFRALVLAFAVAGLLVSLGGVWRVGFEARSEIDRLAVANAETSQWALAQSEVDVLKLRDRLLDAALKPEAQNLTDVRRRFDVFYSRISILSAGNIFAVLRADVEVDAALIDVQARLDIMVPVIDGPNDILAASLPELTAEVDEMASKLRFVSLRGVERFSEIAVDRRNRVATVLTNLAVFASLLVGLFLAVLVGLLAQLFQTRRARLESTAAENRLRAVVETALDAVVVTDCKGVILDHNGAAEKMFGYTGNELLGRPISVIVLPDRHDPQRKVMQLSETLLAGSGISQFVARHRTGRRFPIEVATSLTQDTDRDVLVSFVRDISARVAAEKEIVGARDKALAGEKAKTDLLAVMSHEMRTPINGIMGSLELLADSDLSDKQRRFVDAMQSSGGMLLRNVNAVLDISRIDAEGAAVVKEVFAPLDVIETAINALHGQAVARGNVVVLNVMTDDLGLCLGDAASLGQVMLNLIGNAIKFTKDGKITVEVERIPRTDDLEIRVTDTGVGIASEDYERIFSEFVTLDARYAREVEGSGLGLAIVRRLCHLMQGEVGVESELGGGSVFWVRIPLPPVIDEPEEQAELSRDIRLPSLDSTKSLRILLVEDNEINLLVAREMLVSLGCRVTEARNGQVAIACASAEGFDLILMDISMPGMNGLDAAALIRSECPLNSLTPIVALTAHAQSEEVSRFRQSGISDVVIKPVGKEDLRALLVRLTRKDSAGRKQLVTLLNAPTDAKAELVSMLGLQEAERITSLAHREIAQKLGELTQLKQNSAVCEKTSNIHHLAGLAGIVGFEGVRTELLAAQSAAHQGDGATAMARLIKAQQVLDLPDTVEGLPDGLSSPA